MRIARDFAYAGMREPRNGPELPLIALLPTTLLDDGNLLDRPLRVETAAGDACLEEDLALPSPSERPLFRLPVLLSGRCRWRGIVVVDEMNDLVFLGECGDEPAGTYGSREVVVHCHIGGRYFSTLERKKK